MMTKRQFRNLDSARVGLLQFRDLDAVKVALKVLELALEAELTMQRNTRFCEQRLAVVKKNRARTR